MLPAASVAAVLALITSCIACGAAPFTILRSGERFSLMDPNGQPFFSLGVCVVTQGDSRENFDPENPPYAAWQQYARPEAWADATLRRLADWKFTTVGGWSDYKTLRNSTNMLRAFTPVLHIGSTAGAPWWDMWDPKNIRRMEDVARTQILKYRDDPRLLGYYTDNELGWWNATLWKMTLEQSPTSGQRKRLVQLLRDAYQNDWTKLEKDFVPENAASWRELQKHGMLFVRPGGRGIRVMREFLAMIADRYYQLTRDIIRKYDRRALILGDRYQSFYYPEVARAAAKYVDAISSNLNAHWNDGTFLRCYLDTLHRLTGKPILISEFYMAAMENTSGNKNSQGIFPTVTTQTERAAAARRTLQDLCAVPYVIGIDWFQHHDEPRHGRADGENFNFGLLDISDRPYPELTDMFARFDCKRVPLPRPDASQGIPPAPADPLQDFTAMKALRHWDRDRGFVKPNSEFPIADLYVCWKTNTVYLAIYAWDLIEDAFYSGRSVPKNDRPLWTINCNPPVRARLGAGREPIVSDPAITVHNLSGLNLLVRNIAVIELPAARFGKPQFTSGDSIELSSTLLTHGEAYRMDWTGRFRLSD
ncbi:MAG TPA: hypothetical protein VFC26_09785 [Verrucomicrobiae bacterium]|nr:hypothetical protein [Verrucomicrobiae bacterium]